MQDTLSLMPLWAFAAALGVTFAAGIVKGVVGFAMPLVMVSGLSVFLEPQLAIAGLVLPTVATNFLQVARYGVAAARAVIGEFWRYILIVCVMIGIVAQFVTMIPTQTLYLVLGIPVVLISLVQLSGVRVHIPPHRRRAAEWGVGMVAGGLGGLTGTWGPPTVLYLIALETPKAKQLLVQGVVYGVGAVALFLAHLQSGLLNGVTAPFSAALLIPAFLGIQIGFWLSDRLDADRFRTLTLIVLIIAGVNLVRRGIVG